jgi:hypothetical protein
MQESYGVLIDLLADTDALFRPGRFYGMPDNAMRNLWQRRREYVNAGMRWASGEATEAGRKESQRDLEQLADDGLVSLHRHQGRTQAVRLTEQGDQMARALAGLPGVGEALEWMRLMRCIRDLKFDVNWLDAFRGLVPETLLCGHDWWPNTDEARDARGDVMWGLTPALSRLWVETEASTVGCLWYRLTPAGEQALDDSRAKVLPCLPREDLDAMEQYNARLQLTRSRLEAAEPPDPNEIAPLPIPASYAVVNHTPMAELIAIVKRTTEGDDDEGE